MDGNRFDTWTRTRAIAANRRSILGWSLTAGFAATLAHPRLASAQFGGTGSCTYAIALTSSLDAGATVTGTLVVDIGDDGAIDTGSLTLDGQPAASVVGQANGPAIDLLAALSDGTILSLTGVAGAVIDDCASPVFGVLANPDSTQIGTWTATPGAPTTSSDSAKPPPAAPTSTPTPASVPDSSACDPPKMICGQNCCPAGADCLANGACVCPAGTEECGIACFPSCADGTPLEPVNCLCPTG